MPTETQLARLIVTVPPASPVITVDECLGFLKNPDVTPGEIELLVAAATDYAEDTMACSLVERTMVATFFNGEPLILTRGPVIQVVSIAGAASTSTDQFEFRACGHGLGVVLKQTVAYPISITYRAGYPTAAQVPAAFRLAILQHVGTLFRNRESASDVNLMPVPDSYQAFLRLKSRAVGVG